MSTPASAGARGDSRRSRCGATGCIARLRHQPAPVLLVEELIVESLERAEVFKLNDEELLVVAGPLGLAGDESSQLRQLAARFNLKAVALTKGAHGSTLLVGDGLVSRHGSKLNIADTVGAGDSYIAALTLGLLAGLAPETIVERAHRMADYVCTQPGAMPPILSGLGWQACWLCCIHVHLFFSSDCRSPRMGRAMGNF